MDVSELERVTRNAAGGHDVALDLSPDGEELIYDQQTSTDSDTDGSLWIVRLRDLRARRLTTASSPPNWWARWSPDGRQIIFASERLSQRGHIYSVRPDGSGLKKIFTDKAGRLPIHPTWSPDGRQILFALNPINDQFQHLPNELYLIDADGGNLRLALGGNDFKSQPEWRK